nr:hypothetical protein [Tanacetum cinerariifolium]
MTLAVQKEEHGSRDLVIISVNGFFISGANNINEKVGMKVELERVIGNICFHVTMEYLVKISKKERILELKRVNMKITDFDIQYAVSIKEDTANLCLHFTNDHEGMKINTSYLEKINTPYSSYRM